MSIEKLGPYQIEDPIGRGGMGTVYRGVNGDTGEPAAVKVLSSLLAADESFRERFDAEIETLRALKHPNIVQLYGYGEQDGHVFFAMELVEGTSLEEELQNGRRLEWRETLQIGVEVCRALKHAHDCGVIHRDLKPANLLLTQDEQIKLADFGIAKLFGHTQMTALGGVLGTADYMAPEQAEGRPVTPRSDLYSLGSVLYALLTGRPPFRGKSMGEVLHLLRYAEPKPVRNRNPEVPAALEKIITQLLEKDPQKRIPTALALSNVLQATKHALSLTPQEEVPESSESVPQKTLDHGPSVDTEIDVTALLDSDVPTQANAVSGAVKEIRAVPEKQATQPVDSHFTTVDEQELGRRPTYSSQDTDGKPLWMKVLIAIGLFIITAGSVWYVSLPVPVLDADRLYAQIEPVVSTNNSLLLLQSEDLLRQFVERFPEDTRSQAIGTLLLRIDLQRQRNGFEIRTKKRLLSNSLSSVEQAYWELLQMTDPEEKLIRLEALLDLYGSQTDSDENLNRCLELVKLEIRALHNQLDTYSKSHRQTLEERLRVAQQLAETDPEQARAIWKGIITLYTDKSWAKAIVQQAREALRREAPE
jgi:serine/threonine-protein kinase